MQPSKPASRPGLAPAGLLAALRPAVVRHPPFQQMDAGAVDLFLSRCEQRYYAPGETLVEPADGTVEEIFFIREGAVTGTRGVAELAGGAFLYEPGELFPVNAAVAHRPVTATYKASADTFVLVLPRAAMIELAAASPQFSDFLTRRVAAFLELSRQALQTAYASQTLSEQSLETRLGELLGRPPVTCGAATPVREALQAMYTQRIGSIVVTGEHNEPLGILTRHDVLGRVALAQVALDTPVGELMVTPVLTLTADHTAQDAALLMSQHGIRHVPVTRAGKVAGVLSERDLFAMQRLSLKQIGGTIRSAPDVPALRVAAGNIRRFARNLLGQGVQARQLTGLVSHLNDSVMARLLELLAPRHGIRLGELCWIALGSEGREEQTIATDQDNALILPDGIAAGDRAAALAFGKAMNEALAECGYPLCPGGIMAGQPACCRTLGEWRERFSHWIEHGAPQDLLDASIFFDLRGLAGNLDLARDLHAEVLESARRTPRFLKQMALNALGRGVPLNWLGGVDTDEAGTVDLKLQGTAIFVDGARLYALAHGVHATNTRERLEAIGRIEGVAPAEYEAWIGAFEFLQMLRLRRQLEPVEEGSANRIELAALNNIDRRILKESFRVARQLQQRMHLDYER